MTIFGNGILLAQDEQWRRSRRIVRTAFSTQMINRYVIVFNEYANQLVHKLEPHADTGIAFNVWSNVANTNTDMIFENMADHRLNALKNDDYSYFKMIEEESEVNNIRFLHPILYFDKIYELFLNVTGKWRLSHKTKQFVQKIIQKKILRDQTQPNQPTKNEKTLIDILLKASTVDPTYTDKILHNDLLNMIQAGSTTTTAVVSFTMLMLAIHQNIQENVYHEIISILEDHTPITVEQLDRMEYMEQCINETLRKFPPIPLTFRRHQADIILNENQTIPANHNIIVSTYALHHDKNIYSNADTWNPHRFSKQASAERDKNAFLPFGVGPRMCIGARYAILSAKMQLAYTIRAYSLHTDTKIGDLKLIINTVLGNEHGYWLELRRR